MSHAEKDIKKVLIINVEFPPISGPSVQRVLKFTRYIHKQSWQVTVLTSAIKFWHMRDDSLSTDIPEEVDVYRLYWYRIHEIGRGLANIFSFLVYPFLLFSKTRKVIAKGLNWRINIFLTHIFPEPDLLWVIVAILNYFRIYKKYNFNIVITSGPPHASHLIGLFAKYFTKVQWLADFRDPWVDSIDLHPKGFIAKRLAFYLEKYVLKKADTVITVSDGWKKLLQRKIEARHYDKFHVIHNGYDPIDIPSLRVPLYSSKLTLHHNGSLYPRRDCSSFFRAISKLKEQYTLLSNQLQITFTGIPDSQLTIINELYIGDIIYDIGRLSHIESLKYSMDKDVLLLLNDNADKASLGMMTGKVYEYVALGKPILALTSTSGDLAQFLSQYEYARIVDYDDVRSIIATIIYLMKVKKDKGHIFSKAPSWINEYSREKQSKQLVRIMNSFLMT